MTGSFFRGHWSFAGAQFVGFLVLVVAFVGCQEETSSNEEPVRDTVAVRGAADSMTVWGILQTDSRFSTLVAGLDSTGLDSLLATREPYTLLAPPNSAFAALPEGTVPFLLAERRDRYRTILAHHVIEGRVNASALADTSVLTTLTGDSLQVQVTDTTLTVGNARVVARNIKGENGLIHVIDQVLRPPPSDEQ